MLCHKILQNVSILLDADRGSLFLVQGERAASPQPQNGRLVTNTIVRLLYSFPICFRKKCIKTGRKCDLGTAFLLKVLILIYCKLSKLIEF